MQKLLLLALILGISAFSGGLLSVFFSIFTEDIGRFVGIFGFVAVFSCLMTEEFH